MIPIVIGSVTDYSGKSLVWLGMGLRFRKDGLKVGFFKPIGALPVKADGKLVDEDALFLKRAIGVKEPLESLCPVVLTEEVIASFLKGKKFKVRDTVLGAFNRLSKGKDLLLVHGLGRLSSGTVVGLSELDFVQEVKAKVILIDKFENPLETLDGFLYALCILKDRLLGVVFNLVPPGRIGYIKEVVVPYLESRGISTLGIVPKDPVIGAVPVREFLEALHGELLCGEERLDELVEHCMIGAMNVESALKYFRRVSNKAVITGGDRSDIQLAALETPTKCLILTGGLYPCESILTRAREMGTPVMVVKRDTAETIDICEGLASHLHRWSKVKLSRMQEVVEREIDFGLLYKKLRLKPT
ncbi:MAG TPA: phosphotransacetylase family protein [Candidatus Hypogeohydataceae bacterium YC38]